MQLKYCTALILWRRVDLMYFRIGKDHYSASVKVLKIGNDTAIVHENAYLKISHNPEYLILDFFSQNNTIRMRTDFDDDFCLS